ncbi:MAG: Lrp/AsnC family transcriptional regulator [Proteobacteria bacterium]|nr:Lrp/AsnC family transcriptional regulator [Pseudomonadota bacterium]
MQEIVLDKFDLQILDQLQRNARTSNNALSERVHLSPSQVSRRIQHLEEIGLVDSYVALLNPLALGLRVTVFTNVSLERHGMNQSDAFDEGVRKLDEVLECYAVTGEADYMLRVLVPDLASLSEFMMHKLLRLPGVSSVKSNVVLQEIKRTTRLPLNQLKYAPTGNVTTAQRRKRAVR